MILFNNNVKNYIIRLLFCEIVIFTFIYQSFIAMTLTSKNSGKEKNFPNEKRFLII